MAKRLQILIGGDSRVRNLIVRDPSDPDRYDCKIIYQASADMPTLGKYIEAELERNKYDIVVVVGVHCDLSELRPTGAGGRGELCQALTSPDLESLYTYITGFNYAWRSKFPDLSVFWALPHEADILRYNEHRVANVLRRGEMCTFCTGDSQWSAAKLQEHVQRVAQRIERDVAVVMLQASFEEVFVRDDGDGLHLSAASNTELFERVLAEVIPRHPLPPVVFPGPIKTPDARQHAYKRRRARLVRGKLLREAGVIEPRGAPPAALQSRVMKAPASRRTKVKNNRLARRQAAEVVTLGREASGSVFREQRQPVSGQQQPRAVKPVGWEQLPCSWQLPPGPRPSNAPTSASVPPLMSMVVEEPTPPVIEERSPVWDRVENIDTAPPDVVEGRLMPYSHGPGLEDPYPRGCEGMGPNRAVESTEGLEGRRMPYSQGPVLPRYDDFYRPHGPADDLEGWRLSHPQGPARGGDVRGRYEPADELERWPMPYSQGPVHHEDGWRLREPADVLERRPLPYSQGPVATRFRTPDRDDYALPGVSAGRGTSYLTAQVRCLTFLGGPSDGAEGWCEPYPRGPDVPRATGDPWPQYGRY